MPQIPPPSDFDDQLTFEAPRPRRLSSEPVKHSGLGVASLIIACVCLLLLLIGTAVSTVAVMDNPTNPDESPMVMAGGCMIILGMLGCLVGVVLGAVGCAAKDRKLVTAVIGLCLNAVGIVGICGLMALGMAAG